MAPIYKMQKQVADSDIIKYLSEWTTYIKQKTPSPQAMAAADLQTMFGYSPRFSNEKEKFEFLLNETKDWVSDAAPYDSAFNYWYVHNAPKMLLDQLRLRRKVRTNIQPITLDFVKANPWIWGAPGSANNMPDDWLKKKLPSELRTKWMATLLLTPDQVESYIVGNQPNIPQSFIKPDETVKQRAIIATGMPIHIQMSIIQLWLEANLDVTDVSDVFGPAPDYYERILHAVQEAVAHKWLCVPADESKYDRTKRPDIILAIVDVFASLIRTLALPAEKAFLLSVLAKIKNSILPQYILVKVGPMSAKVKYEKGILSGYKWTALLDTFQSWCKQLADKFLSNLLAIGDIKRMFLKGDDVFNTVTNASVAALQVRTAKLLGYEMNPQKNVT